MKHIYPYLSEYRDACLNLKYLLCIVLIDLMAFLFFFIYNSLKITIEKKIVKKFPE